MVPSRNLERGLIMRAGLWAFLVLAATSVAADDRRSTYEEMSPELRAMQDDPTSNPAIFTQMAGEALFSTPAGAADQACADCHEAGDMARAATRYPMWDEESGRAVDLTARVDLCRIRHQEAEPFAPEEPDQLAILTWLSSLAQGMPITPSVDPRMEVVRAAGEEIYNTRMGQLNLSCAQCHDDRAGGRLRAAQIPQAHPTGYPQYRLEWEGMGTLERRLGNCMNGVRAERFAHGSEEIISLTAYLMQRAAGMPLESLPVRP